MTRSRFLAIVPGLAICRDAIVRVQQREAPADAEPWCTVAVVEGVTLANYDVRGTLAEVLALLEASDPIPEIHDSAAPGLPQELTNTGPDGGSSHG